MDLRYQVHKDTFNCHHRESSPEDSGLPTSIRKTLTRGNSDCDCFQGYGVNNRIRVNVCFLWGRREVRYQSCSVVKETDEELPDSSAESDLLRVGRPKSWSSIPGKVNSFHFSTQPPT
jgi:hypothetical protein